MKKMYYFAATLLIMLFAACSNDHIGQDDDDGIVTDPTGEAWISLDIKTTAPKALGRALNNPDNRKEFWERLLKFRQRQSGFW